MSALPAVRDPWQTTWREVVAALAVLAALAALAAFALWGMPPTAGSAPTARERSPAVTAPAQPREREGEERGD